MQVRFDIQMKPFSLNPNNPIQGTPYVPNGHRFDKNNKDKMKPKTMEPEKKRIKEREKKEMF